jgi:hypothetical protein
MAARARTLRGVNPLPLIARVLRGAADLIDPPVNEPVIIYQGSGGSLVPSPMYEVDFVRGEVRLNGKVISRG